MAYLLYIGIKLLSYIAWCWLGLRLWRAVPSWPGALGLGLVRLAIGVVLGVMIFVATPVHHEELLWKYLAIYAPVRLVEWLILAAIILRTSFSTRLRSDLLWCVGGIAVSFLADFASPEGVAGHFCVGRCLC